MAVEFLAKQVFIVTKNTIDMVKSLAIKLQQKDQDVLDAYRMIDEVVQGISVGAFETVPRKTAIMKNRSNTSSDSVEVHYKRTIAIPLLDNLSAQMDQRPKNNFINRSNSKPKTQQPTYYHSCLSESSQRSMVLTQEKGASSWLTTLPISEHGFALHKSAFRDALALRYGWDPPNTPSHCICGKSFTVEHALSCLFGGYPTLRHNEIRNLTANLLSEVCHNVTIEPTLQPVTRETFKLASTITEIGARSDIAADGFWGGHFEKTFFDIRVLNPLAPSNTTPTPSACYRRHEKEKQRAYEQRIREIEHASFTPIVLSTTGGMGPIATTFYKRLADRLASKWISSYSQTIELQDEDGKGDVDRATEEGGKGDVARATEEGGKGDVARATEEGGKGDVARVTEEGGKGDVARRTGKGTSLVLYVLCGTII
eukprot:Em0007g1439a